MFTDDNYCFACGKNNPQGLKMDITRADGWAEACVVLNREHQGWRKIAHGGMVATLLDEIMAHAVIHKVPQSVTAELKVRFKQAAPVETPLLVRGEIVKQTSRVIVARAELRLEETGQLLAQAESKFLVVK